MWLFQSMWDSLHLAGQARRGFCSVLSQRSGRPCVEISHCEVEAASFREVAELSRFCELEF